MNRRFERTAYVHTVVEGLCYLWIHFDKQILFFSKILISFDYSCVDPITERFPHYCICDVDEPLAWNLVYIPVIWKILRHFFILPCYFKDARNVKILILRNVEYLHFIAFDATLFLGIDLITYYLRLPVTRSLRK